MPLARLARAASTTSTGTLAPRTPRWYAPTSDPPGALPAHPELHLHFHGITAEDVAAILADVNRDCRGRVD